ncbi:MAG TPA: PAS domain-containing protein, partial [Paracoccaceae bacterium]
MAISFRGGDGVAGAGTHHAMISEVRAYWEALRHGPRLPLRAQIDPRGIEGALEGAFILERVAPGIARFRLAGMQLVELIGMEVRGMPVSALFDPTGRQRLASGLEQVFTSPAVLDLRLEAERGIGRPSLTARMVVLPLRRDSDGADLALGCLATEGEIGRRPRRFFIANAMIEPLPTADSRPQAAPQMVA